MSVEFQVVQPEQARSQLGQGQQGSLGQLVIAWAYEPMPGKGRACGLARA
ncbi:hypothetical protein [Nonomuraea rosea]